MNWVASASERDRFVDDLLRHMTLEEKIGQLDLEHPSDDPALEKAVASGRVGGVTGATAPHRLQQLAMGRSRLGLPLLLIDSGTGLPAFSDIALAASWDRDLVRGWGGIPREALLRKGYNVVRAPRVTSAMNWDGREPGNLSACEPRLLASLSEAFARGTATGDPAMPYQVLSIPWWTGQDAAAEQDWAATTMRSGSVLAIDSTSITLAEAGRLGFAGLLWAKCRELHAAIARTLASTSTRSLAEAAERDIADGSLALSDIDFAVRGVLTAKHAIGLFASPDRIANDIVERQPAPTLADARARSMVLLRNEAGLLPLSPVSDRVLVVGAGDGPAGNCLEALTRSGISAVSAPGMAMRPAGANWAEPLPGDHFALSLTRDAARRADFALVVLDDRHFRRLSGREWPQPTASTIAMVTGLASAGVRLAAVVATEGAVDLATLDQHFSALLLSWAPGEGYEAALAAILSGRQEPQGRLPFAVGRYPFGHGVGFSETVFSGFRVEILRERPVLSIKVRNAGNFRVRETVQIYVQGPRTSDIWLAHFEQPVLAAGEEIILTIPVEADMLIAPGAPVDRIPREGRYTLSAGKDRDRRLSGELDLTQRMARTLAMGTASPLRLAAG